MWNIFFSKFYGLLFVFLFFYYFWHFFFQFRLSVNFYVFLFCGLEILSKNFGKLWNIFLKNRHLKSKILHKFHRLLFFLSILVIFFSYFTYQNLSKNSKSSFKKKIDVSKFFFQNSAVDYLFFFYFWYFISNVVYLYLSTNFRNFYVLFYFMD